MSPELSPAQQSFWHSQADYWQVHIEDAKRKLEYAQRQYNIANERLGNIRILGSQAVEGSEAWFLGNGGEE